MNECWDSCHIISSVNNPFNKPKNGEYFEIDEWFESNIEQCIKLININPDIVIANYIFTSKILDYFPNALKVLDTHDKLADRHIKQKQLGINPDFFYTTRYEECKACQRADIIIAIQDEEKKYFQELNPNKKVVTISHIEAEKFINKEYKELKEIGFLGSFSSMNIESLKDFLYTNKGLDFLQRNNINLNLAGSICNYFKEDISNIIKHGYVENLEEFYKSMDLFIAPMTNGDGQNIKTIEALSYGVPIFGTKLGFRGTEATYGTYFNDNKELVQQLEYCASKNKSIQEDSNESKRLFKKYTDKNNKRLRGLLK